MTDAEKQAKYAATRPKLTDTRLVQRASVKKPARSFTKPRAERAQPKMLARLRAAGVAV